MPKAGLENGVWVLVCDGRKAILLQNAGDRVYPKLETRRVTEHSTRPTHELGTDEPGRTFSRAYGAQRSAMEPTDLERLSEEAFLKDVTADLDRKVISGQIKHVILVAPPRALGVIRQHETAHLRGAVLAEVERDYVREPLYEIERHLTEAFSERGG